MLHAVINVFLLQVSVFDKAAEMYSGDSCKMARLVGTKSCLEVHAHLLKVQLLFLHYDILVFL